MSSSPPLAADAAFPYALVINLPFPTHRLAQAACRALAVDQELSALVQRSFHVVTSSSCSSSAAAAAEPSSHPKEKIEAEAAEEEEERTVLQTTYRATTNRMLRVAVNGFFDQVGTVVQVMQELDTDVLQIEAADEDWEGTQGVEVGLTGETITGG